MDLRQLRYFAAIAEEQSFTKAAQKLHISQPPLSQQLSNLEDDLGVRLFIRTSRSVQLSEAGSVLLPHVHAVLDRLDEARLQVQRVAQGLEGCVTLGLTGSHFLGTLPQFIREFRQERPRVDVSLKEMPPADQLTGLQDRRLDLCLSRGIPADPAFSAELLWHDSSVVVLPPGHPLSHRKRLRLHELKNEDFVFFRLGSSIFADSVYQACLFSRFEPKIVQQVVEVPAVVNLVAAGLGVSIVPESIARLRADAVAICELGHEKDMPQISSSVYLMRRSDEDRQVVLGFAAALSLWARDSMPAPLSLARLPRYRKTPSP
ncbi:LysR substrate-binding domain-containing protein [Achromobacter aegrifaciens]|jgi:DNA-binding transcriptional LysR family regulator|uniref:LysR substrate-binding domain-containing protein n=1 Tax=Achromobacter aegrifaciens TaxID=1287736 RepID=UPI000F7384F9|nr:LysR substrate-binding domain-containing protein [Achromobacter aegrifaciens]RSF07814.1 LysR family transcriptional regulator [Achromobacter aegrifaciens]CAB3831416.1 HTH-type transcriptional regulator BenM [Achromobacter aegrifaciens]